MTKRKIWILGALICLVLVCVCTCASAAGMILKNEAGTTLQNGASLTGQGYYKIYVSGLPSGCNTIYTDRTENMDATEPDGWEDEPRELATENGKKVLYIIPDPFADYDQEILFARIDESDTNVRRIKIYYDRNEVANVRPRITTAEDPVLGQEDYTLSWTAVNGAERYFVRWQLPTGDSILYLTEETSVALEEQDGRPAVEYAGNYSAEVIPLIDGHFGRRSSMTNYWVNTPEADGRVWLSADQLNENNNEIWIRLNESVNYHISAPGADEVRFMNGEGFDSSIQLNHEGNTDYFWMPGRQDWNGDRYYMVYAQARFGDEWVTSNTISLVVHIDGDINGDFNWTIKNTDAAVRRDGLVEIEVQPMQGDTVDFYGAYISHEDPEQGWIADSHWFDANPDGPTTILMPVAGCATGTYDVHVYAARFGSRNKDSDHTEPITVTDAANNTPITISMKPEYETGEPLWIRAWYGNPQNLDPNNAWIHVTICPADEDDNSTGDEWYSEGGGFDFWDNGYNIGWRGTYVLTAWIYQNVEGQDEPQEVDGTRTTFTFDITAENELDNPAVTMTADHAHRGDQIELRFGETANAENYGYWIHREEDDENLMNDGRGEPGTFNIDTNQLEPGIYWVETDVMARGYQQGHRTLHFALLDNETERNGENDSYYFSCTADDDEEGNIFAATGEDIRFIYYVPGADQVKILEGSVTGDDEDQIEHAGGPGVKGWRSWDEPGSIHEIYGSYYYNGEWSEPSLLCQINVLGRLDEPNVDMPRVINAGESVTISIHETPNATEYSYWYSFEEDDENCIDGDSDNGAFEDTIRQSKFTANRVYHFYFDVRADGYMGGHTERTLYVLGDDTNDENLWLNVNPSENQGINPVGVGETFIVEAHAENAQDIFIRRDSDGNINSRYGSDYIWDVYGLDGPDDIANGKASFTAFARVNGCELLVRRAEADITGTEGAVYADAPTLTIEDTTVARNEFLEAAVTSTEQGAYEYHVNIFREEDGEWFGDYSSNQSGTILIPTNNLPEGQYRIGAWVRVHGKFSGDTGHDAAHEGGWKIVTITECENSFYCSTDTVQVFEPMTVSICAPGAERIRFSSGYDRWDDDNGWDGDSWYSDNVRWDIHSDTTSIKAEAMYNGNWELIGSQRITITAKDDLAQADLSSIPAMVTAGQNQTFSFSTIPNAEHYDIEIRRNSDGNWRYTGVDADPGQETVTFRLNGEGENDFLHNPNEGYTVWVTAKAIGYNASGNETTFVTVPADIGEHGIELSADRDAAESNAEEVHFTVIAEGSSIVKIYHEGQWFWAPTNEEGKAEFDIGFDQDILQPVWATACYDPTYTGWGWEEFNNEGIDASDLTYEGMSNIVNISVYSNGETMMPDWAEVPEEVAWGELLRVDIGGEGNAETLHIRIQNKDNDEIFFKEIHERGTTTYLPTAMLTVGEEYRVSIDGMCPGHTWNHLDGDFRFTVVEPEGDPETFMISDRDEDGWVFVNEPYYVQMYAPGAIQLKAVNADDSDDVNAVWDGDHGVSGRDGFWWEEAGEHTLNGYARYPVDDNHDGSWEQIGSVTLDVVNRDLEAPEIRTASVVDNTDDLPIAVKHVPYGNDYHMEIHGMDGRYVYSETLTADPEADYVTFEENNAYLNFIIPAKRLTDGESYWIDCYVNGALPGMNGNGNSRMILVANKDDEGNPNIDTNIGIFVNKTEVAVNEMFTVEVNARGAKAIRIRFGDQWRAYAGNSVRDQFSEYQPYQEVLYAQACYDQDLELPEDMWNFDWDSVDWGSPSQAYEMNFYALGQANEPWFDAPETVRRGEILTIRHIGLDETANEAHANILWNNPGDDYENWVFGDDWQGWNENTREIHLSTNNLSAGIYWLAVDCSGIGYTGNRRWYQFAVTEDDEHPEGIVFNAPETVMLGEPLPVSIYAPDAWRIGFATDGGRWDLDRNGNYTWDYDMDWWTDTENVRWDDPNDLGEHTITAYVLYGDTEEELSIEKTVTVLDPNLAIPEIRVNDVVSKTTSLKIKVPVVEHGDVYDVILHKANDGNEAYHGHLEATAAVNGILTFTVSKTKMSKLAEGEYWIDCYVDTYEAGYFRSENHRAILVQSNADNRDGNIEITVENNQLINQDFPINVSAEGAKAFIIHCGDHAWGGLADEEGHAEIWASEYQPATETLYVQACYSDDPNLPANPQWNFDWENAGIAWGYPSEQTVQMHFISYGPAGQAYFDAPIVVVRGDVLEVTNINLGDGANEAHANINVNGPGEDEIQVYGYGWHGWDANTRMIHIATSMLEPGNYWLMVDSSGIGRENNRTWHEFTVVERGEQAEHEIIFTVPEKVQTGSIVPINVYAPGASRIGFGIDLDEDHSEYELIIDGEIAYNVTNYRWDEPGTHTITAYAEFEGLNEPVIIDRTLTICDPLVFDQSGLPGYFAEGQENATVTIPLPVNAEWMSVSIHADWDNGRETLYRDDYLTESAVFTVPSEWLTEDKQIRIDWYAYATGFKEVFGGTNIMVVVSPEGTDAVITLDDADRDINNIMTNDPVVFRVSATAGHELTAVRFYDGHGYWENGNEINHENRDGWFDKDGSIAFRCNYNHNDDPGQLLSVFAQVRLDGSAEWQTTNCLRFTVKTPKGDTGGYDFTDLTPIHALRGSVVSVEFSNVKYPEGPISYWADVFSEDGWSFNPSTNCDGNTVMISTSNIPAGRYLIRGRAVKDEEPGWRWSDSMHDRVLIIDEAIPEAPRATFVTPAMLTEIDEEAFAGIAAEVIEISANVQSIHYRAFADSNVKTVIIRNGNTWIDDGAFEGCGTIVVYGPLNGSVQQWAERHVYEFYPGP